jgi:hypothetical protein
MLSMETLDWTFKDKPYDLRERLFVFACVITRLVQYLHTRGPVAIQRHIGRSQLRGGGRRVEHS